MSTAYFKTERGRYARVQKLSATDLEAYVGKGRDRADAITDRSRDKKSPKGVEGRYSQEQEARGEPVRPGLRPEGPGRDRREGRGETPAMAGRPRRDREVTLPKSTNTLKDIPTTVGIKAKLYVDSVQPLITSNIMLLQAISRIGVFLSDKMNNA